MCRIVVLFWWVGVLFCVTSHASTYDQDPERLQRALAACPHAQPKGISCAALQKMATRLEQFAYELHANREAYGLVVLKLQTLIAKQQVLSARNALDSEQRSQLQIHQQALRERLAVIKWLESPES